jgi:hypothetical protein
MSEGKHVEKTETTTEKTEVVASPVTTDASQAKDSVTVEETD